MDIEYDGIYSYDVWEAYCEVVGKEYATSEGCDECYQGHYRDMVEYARHFAEGVGMCSRDSQYFDVESFAHDNAVVTLVCTIDARDGGVYVFKNY